MLQVGPPDSDGKDDWVLGRKEVSGHFAGYVGSTIVLSTQCITASVDKFLTSDEQPDEFQITLRKTQDLLDKVNRIVTDVDRMPNTNEKSIREMVGQVKRITGRADDLQANNR
ncbi:MAG: hypothetical protein VYA69_00725 [Gemmatimonadota bacterium]|nr:hypothetical protein [Gemmatimonadota bacterium]